MLASTSQLGEREIRASFHPLNISEMIFSKPGSVLPKSNSSAMTPSQLVNILVGVPLPCPPVVADVDSCEHAIL